MYSRNSVLDLKLENDKATEATIRDKVKSFVHLRTEMKVPNKKPLPLDPYLLASQRKVRTKGKFEIQKIIKTNNG